MRLLWVFLIALAGAVTGYLFTRFEGSPPTIQSSETPSYVSGEYRHVFEVDDEGTGLERVRVWLDDGENEYPIKEEVYQGNLFTGAELGIPRRIEVIVNPAEMGLADGAATLYAEARDFSWRGNETRASSPLVIDTTAPRVALETGLTYVVRGGAEMVVYSVDEDVVRHGVELGELFFPGYPHPQLPDRVVALYAYPTDTPPGATPQVVAEDRAGNQTRVGAAVRILEKGFVSDTIQLNDGFMQQKVAEISGSGEDGSTLENYLKINRDMRTQNAAEVARMCEESNDEMLWRGAFLQLPNSATSKEIGYGVRRTYVYGGEKVDQQTHLGLDLASTARAPVPAANDGIVVYADDLGIYGKTVLLDHGQGLFSLYGHLSELGVAKGDLMSKGDALGKTGTTGLAGGDHLHFSMLVHGVFVDPLEWLDERWIREHIEPKLSPPEAEPEAAES